MGEQDKPEKSYHENPPVHQVQEFDQNENSSPIINQNQEIKCQGCEKNFKTSSILKHLAHKKVCKSKYSEIEFSNLEAKCNDYKKGVKKKIDQRKTNNVSSKQSNITKCKSCDRNFKIMS